MTTTPELVTTGEHLAGARMSRGLTVEDAAHETNIPAGHLRALEAGDYEGFDGVAYARSFLRLYGNYLGVDVADGLAQLEERRELAGGVNHYPFLDPPDKIRLASELQAPRSSNIPLIAVLLSMAIVFVVPLGFLATKHYFVPESVPPLGNTETVGSAPLGGSSDERSPAGDLTPAEKDQSDVEIDEIVRVPRERIERIRNNTEPEVRKAEVVEDIPGEADEDAQPIGSPGSTESEID